MAIQFNVATRNARLDAIESTAGTSCSLEIRTGSAPATCATAWVSRRGRQRRRCHLRPAPAGTPARCLPTG